MPAKRNAAAWPRFGAFWAKRTSSDSERVIYVGALNKALFPGLRLGYAVVPPALLGAFIAARYLVDRQPSSLAQAVVADFIEGDILLHISAGCACSTETSATSLSPLCDNGWATK